MTELTTRDFFAATAMEMAERRTRNQMRNVYPEEIAREAYQIADAMLAERAKAQPEAKRA